MGMKVGVEIRERWDDSYSLWSMWSWRAIVATIISHVGSTEEFLRWSKQLRISYIHFFKMSSATLFNPCREVS